MLKMIFRGLARYKSNGKKLLILVSLCSTALVMSLFFASSFVTHQKKVLIETSGGNFYITSKSDKFDQWFQIPEELENWIKSQDEVEVSGPILKLNGTAYHLSTILESSYQLIGVDSQIFPRLFPSVVIKGGTGNFTPVPGNDEIPVLRNEVMTNSEVIETDNEVVDDDFLHDVSQWLDLKEVLEKDFSDANMSSFTNREEFLRSLNQKLRNPEWVKTLKTNSAPMGNFDFRDLLDELTLINGMGKNPELIPVVNKKILQVLYPQIIRTVQDQTRLGVPLTLNVKFPRFENNKETLSNWPNIMPITYIGYASSLPLFSFVSYIDLDTLRKNGNLPEKASTSYNIMLKSGTNENSFYNKLNEEIFRERQNVMVFSPLENEMARYYLTVGMAIEVTSNILCLMLGAVIAIFISNSVSLALKSRKREIGTAMAMGLSLKKIAFLFLGEFIFLISFSWFWGALLGIGICHLLSNPGLPGMIFFPNEFLPLSLNWYQVGVSYLFIIVVCLPGIIFPFRGLVKLPPVDFLKEAN